jgi:uncharacterized protein YlxW (UPF0749 family)
VAVSYQENSRRNPGPRKMVLVGIGWLPCFIYWILFCIWFLAASLFLAVFFDTNYKQWKIRRDNRKDDKRKLKELVRFVKNGQT